MVLSLDKKPQSSRVQDGGQWSHAHGLILGIVQCRARIWPDNPYESLSTQAILWFCGCHCLSLKIQGLNDMNRSKSVASSRELVFPRGVEAIAQHWCLCMPGPAGCLHCIPVQWSWLPARNPGPCIWTGCLGKLWMPHQEMLKARLDEILSILVRWNVSLPWQGSCTRWSSKLFFSLEFCDYILQHPGKRKMGPSEQSSLLVCNIQSSLWT